MNYNELIQLYFERSNAMQQYWNLYVIIVGGVLAFSSLRKQPAAITTALVCILFALFAYENLDAMKDTTAQRFATLEAIKQFDSGGVSRRSLEASARSARADSYARHVWKRQGYAHHQRPAYDRGTLRDGASKKKAQSGSEHALKRSIRRPHANSTSKICTDVVREFRAYVCCRCDLKQRSTTAEQN